MIDIRAARHEPERFRAALARKRAADIFDELLAADRDWLALGPRIDDLRARRKLKGKPTPQQQDELERSKRELSALEDEQGAAERRRDELLARVPNPPDPGAPDGLTEDDAEEVRRVG
ncbi:MAG: serine--tRNA ligase, partial [Actinomycetota bacterium]|nr:serine--tRNA ligase [Actinomycetota bacterium]